MLFKIVDLLGIPCWPGGWDPGFSWPWPRCSPWLGNWDPISCIAKNKTKQNKTQWRSRLIRQLFCSPLFWWYCLKYLINICFLSEEGIVLDKCGPWSQVARVKHKNSYTERQRETAELREMSDLGHQRWPHRRGSWIRLWWKSPGRTFQGEDKAFTKIPRHRSTCPGWEMEHSVGLEHYNAWNEIGWDETTKIVSGKMIEESFVFYQNSEI